MTRETKVGLIVAASFLCLVGIVVASKMGRGGAAGENEEQQPNRVAAVTPDKDAKKPPEPPKKDPAPAPAPPPKKDADNLSPEQRLLNQIQNDVLTAPPPGLAIPAPKGDAVALPKGTPPPLPPSGLVLDADPRKKDPTPAPFEVPIPVKVVPPPDVAKKPGDVPPPEPFRGFGATSVEPTPIPKKDALVPPPTVVGVEPTVKPSFPAAVDPIKPSFPAADPIKPIVPVTVEPMKPSFPAAVDPIKPSFPAADPIKPSFPAAVDPVKPSFPAAVDPIKPIVPITVEPVKPGVPAVADPIKPSFPAADPIKPSVPITVEPIKPSFPMETSPILKPQTFPTIPKSSDQTPPTKPEVPTLTTPPLTIGKPGPVVRTTDPEKAEVRVGETNFAALSKRLFGDEKYANALQAYNRDHSFGVPNGEALKANPPRLLPGQQIIQPPLGILERDYGKLIQASAPAPNPIAPSVSVAPAVKLSAPAPLIAPSVGTPMTTAPAADRTRAYVVANPAGERLRDIAERLLGDPNRWPAIYRLNNVQPQFPIPAGTSLRVPVD